MIKSVTNYPVSQIFDIEAGVVYAVPKYQREYTWSKNQWENLFDDVLENDFGYFLAHHLYQPNQRFFSSSTA